MSTMQSPDHQWTQCFVHTTSNNILDWQIIDWPLSLPGNVDSVRQCTGGSHGPTWATVLWNVLVTCHAPIIPSVDISPVPGLGEILILDVLMRTGGLTVRQIKSKCSLKMDKCSIARHYMYSTGNFKFHMGERRWASQSNKVTSTSHLW